MVSTCGHTCLDVRLVICVRDVFDCTLMCVQYPIFTHAMSLNAAGTDMLYLGLSIPFQVLLTIVVDALRNSPYAQSVIAPGMLHTYQQLVYPRSSWDDDSLHCVCIRGQDRASPGGHP